MDKDKLDDRLFYGKPSILVLLACLIIMAAANVVALVLLYSFWALLQ